MNEYVIPILVAAIAATPATIKIFVDNKKCEQVKRAQEFENMKTDLELIKECCSANVKSDLTKSIVSVINQGYSTVEELDAIDDLYIPYHKCGWNGTLDNLHKKVESLEVREK